MLSYALKQMVDVEPVGCMQRYRILEVVGELFKLDQRNSLRLLSAQITDFRHDYVDRDCDDYQIYYDGPRALKWRKKVNLFSLESSKFHVICSKEAKTIPKHQSESIQILLELLPPGQSLLLILPVLSLLFFALEVRDRVLHGQLSRLGMIDNSLITVHRRLLKAAILIRKHLRIVIQV